MKTFFFTVMAALAAHASAQGPSIANPMTQNLALLLFDSAYSNGGNCGLYSVPGTSTCYSPGEGLLKYLANGQFNGTDDANTVVFPSVAGSIIGDITTDIATCAIAYDATAATAGAGNILETLECLKPSILQLLGAAQLGQVTGVTDATAALGGNLTAFITSATDYLYQITGASLATSQELATQQLLSGLISLITAPLASLSQGPSPNPTAQMLGLIPFLEDLSNFMVCNTYFYGVAQTLQMFPTSLGVGEAAFYSGTAKTILDNALNSTDENLGLLPLLHEMFNLLAANNFNDAALNGYIQDPAYFINTSSLFYNWAVGNAPDGTPDTSFRTSGSRSVDPKDYYNWYGVANMTEMPAGICHDLGFSTLVNLFDTGATATGRCLFNSSVVESLGRDVGFQFCPLQPESPTLDYTSCWQGAAFSVCASGFLTDSTPVTELQFLGGYLGGAGGAVNNADLADKILTEYQNRTIYPLGNGVDQVTSSLIIPHLTALKGFFSAFLGADGFAAKLANALVFTYESPLCYVFGEAAGFGNATTQTLFAGALNCLRNDNGEMFEVLQDVLMGGDAFGTTCPAILSYFPLAEIMDVFPLFVPSNPANQAAIDGDTAGTSLNLKDDIFNPLGAAVSSMISSCTTAPASDDTPAAAGVEALSLAAALVGGAVAMMV